MKTNREPPPKRSMAPVPADTDYLGLLSFCPPSQCGYSRILACQLRLHLPGSGAR